MTLSHWQRTELGATLTCEFAVVGGGIIGASTAYWLKKLLPKSKVVLIEAKTLGYGASGRNAGFLLQGAAVDYATDVKLYGEEQARLLWAFTKENRLLIESELDVRRIELQAGGSLILAGSKEEAQRLHDAEQHLRKNGEEVVYWNVQKVEQETKGVGFAGGLHVASGARIQSLKLVREIAGMSGAVILENHPVIAVEHDHRSITLHTTRRNVVADQVIFCTNAYLPTLLSEFKKLIRPIRAQMLATASLPHWLTYPVYSHEGYFYLRQLESGTLLLGGARHLHLEEEVGYEDKTTAGLQASLEEYLKRHFPHLPSIKTTYAWSGVMGFTPDGLPLFGPVPSLPGCYVAAGFNGHGMGYGFRFGKMAAGYLNNVDQEKMYLKLFDLHRLSAK